MSVFANICPLPSTKAVDAFMEKTQPLATRSHSPTSSTRCVAFDVAGVVHWHDLQCGITAPVPPSRGPVLQLAHRTGTRRPPRRPPLPAARRQHFLQDSGVLLKSGR